MTAKNKVMGIKGAERAGAFTLIELLVVIAIIGVLAALIIPLSGVATTKMRISRTKAELNNLVTAIETYKLEVGEYPPDNGSLRLMNTSDTNAYKQAAALNPLYYELNGAIFTNRQFRVLPGNELVSSNVLGGVFKVDGIRNSDRTRSGIPYKGFSVKESQYGQLDSKITQGYQLFIMAVPVPGPDTIDGVGNKMINPWYYDASSTNRHNRQSFDLWAEISVSGKTNIIGNWKN